MINKTLQHKLNMINKDQSIQTIQNKLDELNAALHQTKEKFKESIQSEFKGVFDLIFTSYPEVKQIVWGQGTPGFCDGEPCTFEIYEPTIQIGNKIYGNSIYDIEDASDEFTDSDLIYPKCYSDEEIENRSYLSESDKCTEEKEEHIKIYKTIETLIESFSSVLEDMFDGNAIVKINPEKIVCEYYELD